MKLLIHKVIESFGYRVRSIDDWNVITSQATDGKYFRFLEECVGSDYLKHLIKLYPHSHSQLFQDLAYINFFGPSENGYFVEAGGADGVSYSNSIMFERILGWKGILCEPSRVWHSELANNRVCEIDTRCLSQFSGDRIEFVDTHDPLFSGIVQDRTSVTTGRKESKPRTKYIVDSVSLFDMLESYDAPKLIDFLSLDTEGGELDILKGWSGNYYEFKFVCVEHNYRNNREQLHGFMSELGYSTVLENVSKYDYWFVNDKYL